MLIEYPCAVVHRHRHLILFAALYLAAVPVCAQYGRDLDRVSRGDYISLEDAAWLIGSVSGSLGEETDPSASRQILEGLGFRLPKGPDDRPATIGDLSLLVALVADLQPGFWYGLLPGTWTAHRELKRMGFVPEGSHAGEIPAGAEAVDLVRRALVLVGPGSRGGPDE